MLNSLNDNEMSCQELVELVTEYFEGTLPPAEWERFEAHLGACSGCTNYLQQMRQTIQVLGKLTEETIAPQTRAELLQIFKNWKKAA